MLDKQQEINKRTLLNWDKSIRSLRALKKARQTNEAAVNQAEANKLKVEGDVLSLEKQIKGLENALSALVGFSPRSIERGDILEQHFVSELLTGVSLQLLSNRPDVRQCEFALEQAFYEINRARAAFYPSFTLTGVAGWTNNGGVAIANPGNWLFNAVDPWHTPFLIKALISQT